MRKSLSKVKIELFNFLTMRNRKRYYCLYINDDDYINAYHKFGIVDKQYYDENQSLEDCHIKIDTLGILHCCQESVYKLDIINISKEIAIDYMEAMGFEYKGEIDE